MPKSVIPARIKRLVRQRAKNYCEYCRSPESFATYNFSIEHVFPSSKGGSNHPDNLALACQGCNSFKYNKTDGNDPITGEKSPLYNPRQYAWEEHFAWDDSFYFCGR